MGNHVPKCSIIFWTEVILSELHTSSEEPPNTSMFLRAGGHVAKRTKTNDLARALTQVADKITGG